MGTIYTKNYLVGVGVSLTSHGVSLVSYRIKGGRRPRQHTPHAEVFREEGGGDTDRGSTHAELVMEPRDEAEAHAEV